MYLSQAQQCLTRGTAELNNIKQRADKVHKEALELAKAVDVAAKTVHAAEKEVQELQAQLNPKRARIEADVEKEDEIENVGWTLPDHRCEASRVQKRLDDVLGSRDTNLSYRTGNTGYLQYPRLGLIGFNLQEVIPPALETVARSGRRTRGAGLRQFEGMGRKRFGLSPGDDNELRSRYE